MASEAAAANHSSEEVEKELKPEVKILEPVHVSPPKESVDSPEPEEVHTPVATFVESGVKVEETKTEPILAENIKGVDETTKAEEPVVLVEESEQKNKHKQVEVPPCEEEKKIEDASDNKLAEVEKVPHPEPDAHSVAEESIFEKIKGEPEEKLDEKQGELKVEPSVEEKIGEPENEVEVSKPLRDERAARNFIGDVEVLPDKETEESETEPAEVEKDEAEKTINAGKQSSIQGETEEKLDTEIVEKREESKVAPFVEEKLGESEKTIEVLEQLPSKIAAREFIGNVEVMPDKEVEELEAELAKVEKAKEKKDELVKTTIDGEQSSLGAIEEKVENVDKNPGEQLEAIEEKEVKDVETKPEEISKTEPVEKLEQSTVEPVEEKQEEPGEIVQVPLQSSRDPVEEKVEVLEKLPVKEVEGIAEKEGTVSEAEPEEKQEEFKAEPVDEKVDERTKTPERSSVEAIGDIGEQTLPTKEVDETAVKEVDVSEPEIKPEETEKLEESKVELPEEKPDEPKQIVKAAEEEDKSNEKVEELPANVVKEIQEAADKEVESKPEEIPESKPIESVDEKPVELEEIVDVPVQASFLKKLEEPEELPAKELKEIEDKEPEEMPETMPAEKLKGSEVASIEEKPDELIKTVDVQEQSSPEIDKNKIEKGVELPTKEVDAISEKENEVPEEISEIRPAEKLVEENLNEPPKIVDVPVQSVREVESPAKEVDATAEDLVKVSEEENKHEEINETKPVETIEEKSVEPEKIADVAEQATVEPFDEKLEKLEEFPGKEAEAPVEKEVKVLEPELKPQEISRSAPEEKLAEQSEVTEHEKEPPAAEPSEKEVKILDPEFKPEEISESTPAEKLVEQSEVTEHEKEPLVAEPSEKESKVLEAEIKPEEISKSIPEEKLVEQSKVTEHEKEPPAAEPLEKEVKVVEPGFKPEEISESIPEEKLVEQSKVTEHEKEPLPAEPSEKESKVLEAEIKPEEISRSSPVEKLIEQSEVTEQSEKEPPTAEPVKQGKVEALARTVDETKLLNKQEPTIPETRVEEVSEQADEPNEQKESVKKILEVDPPPEEKVVHSGKTESETEGQEEKNVTNRELIPCEEAKPTESEATEKLVKEEVNSRDIANTKNGAEVEGNGNEEATNETEKCEPATQIENMGRSLKDKLEQEKRDDETTKTDVQTETTNESEDTKAAEDASKEEGSAKTSHKQSNNIMKMVKHSLVKAKKAIIGKSAHPKAPASETKGDEVSK